MNIFYLHKDPYKAASYVYDKHKVKMILESAQMLCTAHRYYGNEDVPYKTAHLNHPSTIWCRQNVKQYYWLYNHMLALGEEYTKRYSKSRITPSSSSDVREVCSILKIIQFCIFGFLESGNSTILEYYVFELWNVGVSTF